MLLTKESLFRYKNVILWSISQTNTQQGTVAAHSSQYVLCLVCYIMKAMPDPVTVNKRVYLIVRNKARSLNMMQLFLQSKYHAIILLYVKAACQYTAK